MKYMFKDDLGGIDELKVGGVIYMAGVVFFKVFALLHIKNVSRVTRKELRLYLS